MNDLFGPGFGIFAGGIDATLSHGVDGTIVIVTHNMQKAARVRDQTAFFNLEATGQPGRLVEINDTEKIFSTPDRKAIEDYISGRFG